MTLNRLKNFSGEFCGNEDYTENEMSQCIEEIGIVIPDVMQVIYGDLEEKKQTVCFDTFNLCR